MIARATLAVLLLAAVPAAAQNLPPTGALPLSQVLAGVESRDKSG